MSTIQFPPYVETRCEFSPCGKYRFRLVRRWQVDGPNKGLVRFIGMNPSTADEEQDDPTMRKLRGFAYRWGYSGFVMLNVFAYRSTDPKGLPEDPLTAANAANIAFIINEAKIAPLLVPCWGVRRKGKGEIYDRVQDVIRTIDDNRAADLVKVFGLNKGGDPKHPLYVKYDTELIHWKP